MTGTERRHHRPRAIALFAENAVTTGRRSRESCSANVSKPVVYEHFGGKEGLYAVVVDREMSACWTESPRR